MFLFFFQRLDLFNLIADIKVILGYGKKTYAKIHSQIYQKGKSPDPPGEFGFKRTRRINFKTLSKVS